MDKEQIKETAKDIDTLVADSVIYVTAVFNSMMTEGASQEEGFPMENLPSLKYPQFAETCDVIPLMLEKFVALRAKDADGDLALIYMKTVAVSQSMAAKDAFLALRLSASSFMFEGSKQERRAVEALGKSFLVRNSGINWKLVKSSFSPHERPKAQDFKEDQKLQLIFRIYMYTTARWYGASAEQAKQIFDQHLKVSWALVMCGMWKEALEDLTKHERLRKV